MRLKPPLFWSDPGPGAITTLLSPFSGLTKHVTRHRFRLPSHHVPCPVLCCGNVTLGGTGKTPLTIDLAKRLQARGQTPHILTRGHKGRLKGPLLVQPLHHNAEEVGDEALLLAQIAPTWVGADRTLTAQRAIYQGATCLLLDDGLQNPKLHKDLSLLVIDGPSGFGNGHVLPAGPLREPLEDALSHVQAAVLIGEDRHNLASTLSETIPVLQARLMPCAEIRSLHGQRVIAFAGIGRPGKFFDTLRDAGVRPLRCLPFPDHHRYTARDIRLLENLRRDAGVTLVTTAKDATKLPGTFRNRVKVVNVGLLWADPNAPERLLERLMSGS